jgi:glycosyltransferase involved in cell wall biosynthesis
VASESKSFWSYIPMHSVLQIGDISGVPQVLSRAQRRMGYKCDVMAFQPHPFEYEVDIYRPTKLPFPLRYAERMWSLSRVLGDYELLHFHWSSLIPFGWDLPLWKKLKKKIIVHHHGDDIRNRGESRLFSRFAEKILVSTPDLLDWSPKAVWLPNPIDLSEYQFAGSENHDGPIRILHAPTTRRGKGTEHVLKAVDDIKRDGYEVDLTLVENLQHSEALNIYKKSDIVVDQLLTGWYGVFAIECMALGKPVCVYIKEDLMDHMVEPPLINASPSNIKQRLIELIEDASLRKAFGQKGRHYIERFHDADVVCRRMVRDVYEW